MGIEYYGVFFFFNDTATTEIYTLSLHDALPIWGSSCPAPRTYSPTLIAGVRRNSWYSLPSWVRSAATLARSEEHTSELQSRQYLVCRLLLEKTKTKSPHDTFRALIPPTSVKLPS